VTGTGVSPGVVEGTARVIVHQDQAEDLADGDVLICHTTDPSWTSLFLVASAVVIDVGSAMSHGAIVARELGIPCVINTGHRSQSFQQARRSASTEAPAPSASSGMIASQPRARERASGGRCVRAA
jgi:phosphoenolpyruvate synthase/pyruvate phosphate dikinase